MSNEDKKNVSFAMSPDLARRFREWCGKNDITVLKGGALALEFFMEYGEITQRQARRKRKEGGRK